MGSGYRHYSGLKGSKVQVVGQDDSVYEYTDLAAAVTAAQSGDTIVLHPGTFTLTAQIAISKPLRMVGLGHPTVTSSGIAGSMFAIDLVAQAAAAECYFENIKFIQGVDNVDVFDVDNASIAQTFSLKFKDCDVMVLDAASTGNAIDMNQTTAGKIMHLEMSGSRANQVDCVDIVPDNAGNSYLFQGVYMTENGNASAVITSAAAKAAIFRFYAANFKTALKALTGGHSDQTVVAVGCVTESVGAALVTGDLAGSQTETLISP